MSNDLKIIPTGRGEQGTKRADPHVQSPMIGKPAPRPIIRGKGFKVFGTDAETEQIASNLNRAVEKSLRSQGWPAALNNPAFNMAGTAAHANRERASWPSLIFEGGLRRQGTAVRKTARICDETTGEIIWQSAKDLEISQLIHDDDVQALAIDLTENIISRCSIAAFRPVRDVGAVPTGLVHEPATDAQTLESQFIMSKNGYELAEVLAELEQATTEQPDNVTIHCLLAAVYLDAYSLGLGDPVRAIGKSRESLDRALALDKNCVELHYARSLSAVFDHDPIRSAKFARKLIDGCENSPMAVFGPWVLGISGHFEEAWNAIDDQLEDYARLPGWAILPNFLFSYGRGDYEQACKEAVVYGMDDLYWGPLIRAAALGQAGHLQSAKKEIDRLLELCPKFPDQPRNYVKFLYSVDVSEHVLEGIGRAGLKLAYH